MAMPNEHGPPSFQGHDSADVTIAAVVAMGCWSRYVELTARWHFRGTLVGHKMCNWEEAPYQSYKIHLSNSEPFSESYLRVF